MATARSERKAGIPTDYYAPRFEVVVEGQKISEEQIGDVLSCKVVLDVANLASFDLSVNLGGVLPGNGDYPFRFVDRGTFDVGRRVAISMGYADRLVPMLTGLITSMTPRFPESGAASMSVSGQDDMILLKGRKPADDDKKTFTKMADWQIAEEIARRNNLKISVTKEGPVHDEVVQKNQDEATFLMERAKRIDFDCFIRTDLKKKESVLHFEKPKDKRDGSPVQSYVFTWGENLINFSPRLTIANQVAKVTVRGWDPMKKEAIVFTADASRLPGANSNGRSGPEIVANALGSKQDIVLDAPVKTQEEAEKLATSILTEKAYQFLTGSGRCIGIPDLRPGDLVELHELGTRFSGDYYVTKVDHSISTSGYFTQFEVRRIHDGGEKAA